MQAQLWALSVSLLLTAFALHAQQRQSVEDRVRVLREVRARIEAAEAPDKDLYQQYVAAFPASFAELGAVLEMLRKPDATSNYGQEYLLIMCQAYDHVDHRKYMRKLLRIGVEANNWGGFHKDLVQYLYPGEAYTLLMFRQNCAATEPVQRRAQISIIYALAPEFTDEELEAIYNSLSWYGEERFPMDWFLTGLCEHQPSRCELTGKLHDKYVKNLHQDRDRSH